MKKLSALIQVRSVTGMSPGIISMFDGWVHIGRIDLFIYFFTEDIARFCFDIVGDVNFDHQRISESKSVHNIRRTETNLRTRLSQKLVIVSYAIMEI